MPQPNIYNLLIKESAKMSCTAGVTELTKRLCLDLADTLTGNVELLADLFEGAASAVFKSETES